MIGPSPWAAVWNIVKNCRPSSSLSFSGFVASGEDEVVEIVLRQPVIQRKRADGAELVAANALCRCERRSGRRRSNVEGSRIEDVGRPRRAGRWRGRGDAARRSPIPIIGASRPLPSVPTKVSLLNRLPTLDLRGRDYSSCPFPAIRYATRFPARKIESGPSVPIG